MKTAPITPATIAIDTEGVPHAPAFGDRYHARAGALAQAEHVFLRGNGLPQRWAGRSRFVILETGFGLGHNFITAWAAWRRDGERCKRLHYVAVEKHPPRQEDLRLVHALAAPAPAGHTLPRELAAALHAAWPPLTGDLHRLAFDDGRVELLLALGDAATWLRRLQLSADALFLDGFAPARNPDMWSDEVFAALPALCADGATAATWSVAGAVRDGLARHGFEVERAPGFAGKREMTVARFAPRHRPPANARRRAAVPAAREAVVIGAGVAGAAAALALTQQGLEVTVLEQAGEVAAGASGNAAGLVRGLVARDDGAHARWHRAAALDAWRQYAPWVNAGRVPGLFDGVLHLGDDVGEMRRLLATQGWPPRYVQVLDAADAAARAAVPLTRPAWFFPDAGWVAPAALVRCMLDAAGASMRLHLRAPVAQLRRQGERWRAVGEEDRVLAEADIVVLANAAGVAQLAPAAGAAACRLGQSRGQVTRLSAGQFAAALPSVPRPRLPMARNGYVIALPDGGMLCGATNHSGDDGTTAPRVADHHHNLQVLARLLECPVPDVLATDSGLAALEGRVGWRCHADDRLPLIGPLAAAAPAPGAAPTQPRHVAREGGLFAITALGARGLTGAMLGARTLAALVCDAPLPIDTDLLDAVDAARHTARAARRRTGGHGGAQ